MSKQILIIEDERKLADALNKILEKSDFNVKIALNGEEGLEFCRKQKPDFILLDLLLPKMSGMDFLRIIKKDDKLKDIPVLILTNLTDDSVAIEAKNLGVVDYLVKSNIKLSDVIEKLK